MRGSNTKISIAHAVQDANKQSAYAAAHITGVEAYLEPVSGELVLAAGAPVGQIYHFYIDPEISTPTNVQISDLVTDSDGIKYIVDGISRYENHTVLMVTSYEQPQF